MVETLAVVAVLGILVALLVPASQKHLQRAKAVKCTANLRQLGVAFATFTSDNDGTLPAQTSDSIYSEGSWAGQLRPYTGNEFKVHSCPMGKGPYPQVTYLYNQYAAARVPAVRAPIRVAGCPSPTTSILLLDQMVRATTPQTIAGTVAVAENPATWWWYPHPWSDGQVNGARSVLFLDGHVELARKQTLSWTQLQWAN